MASLISANILLCQISLPRALKTSLCVCQRWNGSVGGFLPAQANASGNRMNERRGSRIQTFVKCLIQSAWFLAAFACRFVRQSVVWLLSLIAGCQANIQLNAKVLWKTRRKIGLQKSQGWHDGFESGKAILLTIAKHRGDDYGNLESWEEMVKWNLVSDRFRSVRTRSRTERWQFWLALVQKAANRTFFRYTPSY